MKRIGTIARTSTRDEERWKWLFLGLLAAVAILLAASQPAPAHDATAVTPYATDTADMQPDCDETHGLAAAHCHVSTACSIYAQLHTNAAAYANVTGSHPLPPTDGTHLSRTPAPNLQPPKHSSQA